jgi:dienelactone hydrolase
MSLAGRFVRRVLLGSALVVALAAVGAVAFVKGWYVHRVPPAELAALLQSGERIYKPDGPGPFPAVIQFHGCGGVHAADATWARYFVSQGWVAVSVDSLGPRHLDGEWRSVCAGRRLWGRERAGDVLVAMDQVRQLPYVDKTRIVLAGWSHGGWAIMELLAQDPPHGLPTNLTTAPAAGLDGLAGVLLIYPYLGFASLAAREPIATRAPILMLLSGRDTVVPTQASLDLAARLRREAHDEETHVYETCDHCWDQTDLPAASNLAYVPDVTADARARVAAFLGRIKGAGAPAAAAQPPAAQPPVAHP